MPTPELIEVLVLKELQGLCLNCQHFDGCTYRENSTKIIIQCELYKAGQEPQNVTAKQLNGLCMNCCIANSCRLPQKEIGVWHCKEYV